jgi:hypothetical protein
VGELLDAEDPQQLQPLAGLGVGRGEHQQVLPLVGSDQGLAVHQHPAHPRAQDGSGGVAVVVAVGAAGVPLATAMSASAPCGAGGQNT